MPSHPLLSQRDVITCTLRTSGDKKIKVTIYKNFETNILISKHSFLKSRKFNPSFVIMIAEIGLKKAQMFISCAKGDRKIKVIPKLNQTDTADAIFSRRSVWTFNRNIFVKKIFKKFHN